MRLRILGSAPPHGYAAGYGIRFWTWSIACLTSRFQAEWDILDLQKSHNFNIFGYSYSTYSIAFIYKKR
jgi:hypothetical protein